MKKTVTIISTCLAVCLAFHISAIGQSNEKPATGIQAAVSEVTDNRTTGAFNSECKIELAFTGDAAVDAGKVRQVRLSEATDEVGRNLIVKDDNEVPAPAFDSGHTGGAIRTEVKLRNPSRNATTIKVLAGEVELFSPTAANGGLLTIKDALKHPAEPIQNPVLAKYGIQLMYLTKETYEAKKKEIEAQQNGSAAGQKMGDAFGEAFKGMFGGMISNSKDSIQLYVKDPDKRLISLKFVDGNGTALVTRSSWSSADFRNTGLDAPAPPDTQMIVELATPDSLKSYPFKVENIPLP